MADIFISAQRFRDMSYTGWLALLWIPLMFIDSSVGFALSLAFSIFLCVMPGKVGKNEYGPDPLTETPIYNPPGS